MLVSLCVSSYTFTRIYVQNLLKYKYLQEAYYEKEDYYSCSRDLFNYNCIRWHLDYSSWRPQQYSVAQVEGSFNGMVRVKGLVPVDSTNPVGASRVQGVGVSAIIDLKI